MQGDSTSSAIVASEIRDVLPIYIGAVLRNNMRCFIADDTVNSISGTKSYVSQLNDVWANMLRTLKPDNVNVHRAAANDLQAERAARPAAPCATYCYHALELPANYPLCVRLVRAFVCVRELLSIKLKRESSQF